MVDTPLIAIVDDEQSVRIALRRLCSAYGMGTRTFASAEAWHRHPSVMITGRDDHDTRARSVGGGACASLCKPIDADVLIGAIRRAIGAA
jgi:FixJ family two-component response regulator